MHDHCRVRSILAAHLLLICKKKTKKNKKQTDKCCVENRECLQEAKPEAARANCPGTLHYVIRRESPSASP